MRRSEATKVTEDGAEEAIGGRDRDETRKSSVKVRTNKVKKAGETE